MGKRYIGLALVLAALGMACESTPDPVVVATGGVMAQDPAIAQALAAGFTGGDRGVKQVTDICQRVYEMIGRRAGADTDDTGAGELRFHILDCCLRRTAFQFVFGHTHALRGKTTTSAKSCAETSTRPWKNT